MEVPMSRPARLCAVLVAALLAVSVLAGCGSGGSGASGGSSGTITPKKDSSGTPTVDITFQGKDVTPHNGKLKVKSGETVKLHITADKAGEIHVHSSPEQHIEYAAGTTDKTLTLDQPGLVDVESHALDKLIFQVEVR
jgi:hypothetical protein